MRYTSLNFEIVIDQLLNTIDCTVEFAWLFSSLSTHQCVVFTLQLRKCDQGPALRLIIT